MRSAPQEMRQTRQPPLFLSREAATGRQRRPAAERRRPSTPSFRRIHVRRANTGSTLFDGEPAGSPPIPSSLCTRWRNYAAPRVSFSHSSRPPLLERLAASKAVRWITAGPSDVLADFRRQAADQASGGPARAHSAVAGDVAAEGRKNRHLFFPLPGISS